MALLRMGAQRPGGPAPDRITGSLVEAGGVTLRARGGPAFLGERKSAKSHRVPPCLSLSLR